MDVGILYTDAATPAGGLNRAVNVGRTDKNLRKSFMGVGSSRRRSRHAIAEWLYNCI